MSSMGSTEERITELIKDIERIQQEKKQVG